METEGGHAQQSSYFGSQLLDQYGTWENAHIEGYFALTLYVIEQVVHYGKKNHILISVCVLGYLLRDKEEARTSSEPVVHQAGIIIGTLDKGAR